jgi:hypothetical protein
VLLNIILVKDVKGMNSKLERHEKCVEYWMNKGYTREHAERILERFREYCKKRRRLN